MTYILQALITCLLMTYIYTPFVDLPETDPQSMAVLNFYQRGLEQAETPLAFNLEAPMSRVQAARLLYQCAGSPGLVYEEGQSPRFEDVSTDHPDFAAVEWLITNGGVFAQSESLFFPDEPVLQQDLILLLYRLDERTVPMKNEGQASENSLDELAPHIRQAYQWALYAGILENEQIEPGLPLSTGQGYLILSNFLFHYPSFYRGGYRSGMYTVEITSFGNVRGLCFRSDRPSDTIVVIEPGLGGGMFGVEKQAIFLACAGYDVISLEFRGQGEQNGQFEMSVKTEMEDLRSVLDGLDYEHIFLYGISQGGLVAALTASENTYPIDGLILDFPAFSIPYQIQEMFREKEIPEKFEYLSNELFARYAADIMDMDPFAQIANYKGPVLIFHGDQDDIVDIGYSYQANDLYENSELVVFEGAGHGFSDQTFDAEMGRMIEWLHNLVPDPSKKED